MVVVLVVIVLLSLAAYTYSEKMVLEAEAAEFAARQAQARVSADAGIEYAAAMLGGAEDELEEINFYHNPSLFAGVSVSLQGPGLFTIIAPVETDSTTQQIRYGLIDESGKVNLNYLATLDLELLGIGDEEIRDMFAEIPGITDEAVDSVLDWIDEDTDRRQYGAEDDVYQTFVPPYLTKNGKLESLDELLLVNGVTPELLYGEDANRNGLLDANEDDGDLSLPLDNADGLLDLGWSAYFTVHSRESNLRSDGEPRIDVNDSILVDLYDALEVALGEDEAQFIVAYRMFGATNVEPLEDLSEGGATSTGDAATDEALQRLAGGIARQIAGGDGEPVTRGGMDLSQGPSVTVESLYELVDAEVVAQMDSGIQETLTSPWTSDASSLRDAFTLLLDTVTTYPGDSIDGRININQARREVLLGIPDIEVQLVDSIIASQQIDSNGQPLTDQITLRQTSAWLLADGLADVTMMRRLDRYITAKGAVYRLQVLGHSDRMGPVARVDAIIDATSFPPRITGRRDLSELGPGYDLQAVFGTSNISPSVALSQ